MNNVSKLRRIGTMGALMVVGSQLGACGGGVSREKLQTMPTSIAWLEVEDAATKAKQQNVAIGFVEKLFQIDGVSADLFQTQETNKMNDEAEKANTPEAALTDMVADVTGYLLQKLPQHAQDNGSKWRLQLAVGKLDNLNNDNTLDQALFLIRDALINNEEFTNQFRVLSSSKTQADEILAEITGASSSNNYNPDPTASNGSAVYDPRDAYVVEGAVSVRKEDGNKKMTVSTTITASHPKSRETFGSRTFKRSYYFHPGFGKYITEEKNDSIRRQYEVSNAN